MCLRTGSDGLEPWLRPQAQSASLEQADGPFVLATRCGTRCKRRPGAHPRGDRSKVDALRSRSLRFESFRLYGRSCNPSVDLSVRTDQRGGRGGSPCSAKNAASVSRSRSNDRPRSRAFDGRHGGQIWFGHGRKMLGPSFSSQLRNGIAGNDYRAFLGVSPDDSSHKQ